MATLKSNASLRFSNAIPINAWRPAHSKGELNAGSRVEFWTHLRLDRQRARQSTDCCQPLWINGSTSQSVNPRPTACWRIYTFLNGLRAILLDRAGSKQGSVGGVLQFDKSIVSDGRDDQATRPRRSLGPRVRTTGKHKSDCSTYEATMMHLLRTDAQQLTSAEES